MSLPRDHVNRTRRLNPVQWAILVLMGLLLVLVVALFAAMVIGSRRPQTGAPMTGPTLRLTSTPDPQGALLLTTAPTASQPSTLPTSTPAPTPLPDPVLPTSAWIPPSEPTDAEILAVVSEMPLEDKVAQMVMVGFHGRSLAESPELMTMVGTYHVGGLVLLESNAHDPEQLSALTTELQQLAMDEGSGIPLFISINHEGGIVIRITEGITEFPGNMAVAATGKPEYAYWSAALAAQELRAMGVNMNLAPVLDVNDEPHNPVIGVRSFGDDPDLVAGYGRLAVRGSQDNAVIAAAKHFPGHGGVAVDSHGSLPVIDVSYDEFLRRDVHPFEAAVQEGVAAIMTAHIVVSAVDDSAPATLSSAILTGLLRERLGFEGLIMTDSLGMGGVSAGRGQAQAAVEAVKAGADIVLSTSPMASHIAIISSLTDAVLQDEIPLARIDASVMRILKAKYTFGLFESPRPQDLSPVGSPEYQKVADQIAREAAVVYQDPGGILPLPSPPLRLLVVSPDQLPPASVGSGTLFGERLRQTYGDAAVTELVMNLNSGENRSYVNRTALAQSSSYDAIVFGEWELIKRRVNNDDYWQEGLIKRLVATGVPVIVVAWHNPAAVLHCPEDAAFLTAYGNSRAQVTAVAAVLAGELEPMGHPPMDIP